MTQHLCSGGSQAPRESIWDEREHAGEATCRSSGQQPQLSLQKISALTDTRVSEPSWRTCPGDHQMAAAPACIRLQLYERLQVPSAQISPSQVLGRNTVSKRKWLLSYAITLLCISGNYIHLKKQSLNRCSAVSKSVSQSKVGNTVRKHLAQVSGWGEPVLWRRQFIEKRHWNWILGI